jgi:asparagine synthase (glutamine-hydrolysing)
MCGIVGIVDYANPIDQHMLGIMTRAIAHRGPDHEGFYHYLSDHLSVGMGARRLSIIDLSTAANQPICNETDDITIVYNGELYNHLELRHELEQLGHVYRSHSDTETIVHAYEQWGTACLDRFNGMYAFALHDRRSNRMLLARDPMGIKPLYYHWDGSRLVFSSELRGLFAGTDLEPEIDPAAFALYMTLGYVAAPHCIYRGVSSLLPGAYLLLEDQHLKMCQFWKPYVGDDYGRTNIDEWVNQTRIALEGAVKRQLMSDVPVGVLLSGGLDSTIITALAQRYHDGPIDTFSVGFASTDQTVQSDDLYNQDLHHARRVAEILGTRHHEIVIPSGPAIADLLCATSVHIDEPLWESSFISIHLMSQCAREHGVLVVLTGDGGDELFAGYPWYRGARRFAMYEKTPLLQLALPILDYVGGQGTLGVKARDLQHKLKASHSGRYRAQHAIFTAQELSQLLSFATKQAIASDPVEPLLDDILQDSGAKTLVEQLSIADLALWVREHFNQRVDRMSMMNSVEARVPLQDMEVVRLALSIPIEAKLHRNLDKYLLREAFKDIVPDNVLHRPKRPFATPTQTWLRGPLRELVMDTLSEFHVDQVGLVNGATVSALVQHFMAGDDRLSFKVWALFNFHLWHQMNIKTRVSHV